MASTRYFPNMVIATTCIFTGATTFPSRPLLELFPPPEGDGIGAGQTSGLDEARGVQPEIEPVHLRQLRWNGHGWPVAVDVPGKSRSVCVWRVSI